MTQTHSNGKGQPVIQITPDGPGWWRYVITRDGVFLLDGWTAGKRADAKKDAAYRLKEWQARREAAA